MDLNAQPTDTAALNLILQPGAEPPAEKFALAFNEAPAFAKAWQRERPEMPDQSQSAYDLSLATVAAMREWTDQDIANLLIAARRKHSQKPEKALRQDYIGRTIQSAREHAKLHLGRCVWNAVVQRSGQTQHARKVA